MVYAKPPFGGPDAVLAYLSRDTHPIAIANSRLVAFDGERVTFKWKDYRAKSAARCKLMTLDLTGQARGLKARDECIRRFLIHLLPDGFHRIRHHGLFANAGAPRTSRECVGCSTYWRHRMRPATPTAPARVSRRYFRIPVPAAAAG
jgi:Putative transposase